MFIECLLCARHFHRSYFIDYAHNSSEKWLLLTSSCGWENWTKRGSVTCQQSCSQQVTEPGFKSRVASSRGPSPFSSAMLPLWVSAVQWDERGHQASFGCSKGESQGDPVQTVINALLSPLHIMQGHLQGEASLPSITPLRGLLKTAGSQHIISIMFLSHHNVPSAFSYSLISDSGFPVSRDKRAVKILPTQNQDHRLKSFRALSLHRQWSQPVQVQIWLCHLAD